MKKVILLLAPVVFFTLGQYATQGDAVSNRLLAQTWSSFQKLDAARQQIDFQNINTNLLAAAVLHATNHERRQAGLEPLRFSPEARKAATIQTRIMRDRGSISHVNPERPRLRTLEDRVDAAGIKRYRFVAENVATAFGFRYEAGKPFFTRTVNGREVYSYRPGGKPIARHSYASFAEALVQNWMQSPGHRENILSGSAEYLGASCLPEKDLGGMAKFYCTQVFVGRFGEESLNMTSQKMGAR